MQNLAVCISPGSWWVRRSLVGSATDVQRANAAAQALRAERDATVKTPAARVTARFTDAGRESSYCALVFCFWGVGEGWGWWGCCCLLACLLVVIAAAWWVCVRVNWDEVVPLRQSLGAYLGNCLVWNSSALLHRAFHKLKKVQYPPCLCQALYQHTVPILCMHTRGLAQTQTMCCCSDTVTKSSELLTFPWHSVSGPFCRGKAAFGCQGNSLPAPLLSGF